MGEGEIFKIRMAYKRRAPKKLDREPSNVEKDVMRVIDEIQNNASQEKAVEYGPIKICEAKEILVESTQRSVILVAVPAPIHREFITARFVGKFIQDMEKRLKKAVVIYANRTILKRDTPQKVLLSMGFRKRPYSRSRSAVEARLLQDIIGDAQIAGKRILHKAGSKKVIKVYLGADKNIRSQEKLATFAAAFNHLTGKSVEFITAEQ